MRSQIKYLTNWWRKNPMKVLFIGMMMGWFVLIWAAGEFISNRETIEEPDLSGCVHLNCWEDTEICTYIYYNESGAREGIRKKHFDEYAEDCWSEIK